MKCFFYANLLWLLVGCSSSIHLMKPAQVNVTCLQKFKPILKAELYNASVDVMGKHISGLVFFKLMPDSSQRVVFTNEAGVKFFDFGFGQDGRIVTHQVMKKLDKKIVVRTLQKDFDLVMMTRLDRETPTVFHDGENLKFRWGMKGMDCVVTNGDCSKLIRLENSTSNKPQTVARLFGDGVLAPDSITIEHLNFNMKIRLKHLVR
jgi:hypothetical protein